MDDKDTASLIARLKLYRRLSNKDEESRQAKDRKGAKLRRGEHWSDGIAAGRTAITANQATALYERLITSVTRNQPVPQVIAKHDDDEEGARLIQAALLQNWVDDGMQETIKRGGLLAGFSRPVFLYVYWDQEARNGIGDIKTRVIPAHRCIVDNRAPKVTEMEFVGLREEMTRGRLTMLFPDKADAIEEAGNASGGPFQRPQNPLDTSGNDATFAQNVERQVQSYALPAGRISVNTGRRTLSDPLAEKVEVEFLWINDPTPQRVERPKLDDLGRPVRRLVRDQLGDVQMDVEGWEVVDGPFGPLYQPNLKPKTEPVTEECIEKKYKHRRHIAWLPGDDIVLWDVAWDGPIPVVSQRDNYALDGYWTDGLALRLSSLQYARNVIFTMILEKIKFSLTGTYLATPRSGLKGNKLVPRPGQIFQANSIDENSIRRFPVEPVDPQMVQMLAAIEMEMMKILGVSPVSQGQPAGRADSPQTYDKLLEAASGSVVDIAQMYEDTIRHWAIVSMWYIQNYYTHEHFVEVDMPDGETKWKAASALATRGEYAVRIETGSMISHSEAEKFGRAKDLLAMGIYTLPMFAKIAKIPAWREALREKAKLMAAGPQGQWLLGPGGATPTQQSRAAVANQRRSHHAPGGK
jgi:hypothetical protein